LCLKYFILYPGRYTADIRSALETAAGTSGHRWCFDVAKNFRDEESGNTVSLEFSGQEDVPTRLAISLLDRVLGHVQDLRDAPDYAFHLGAKETVNAAAAARFVLLVGDEDFVAGELEGLSIPPARTALHQNYPNPFNPETVIRWDVAEAGRVDLRIYDLAGALIRTAQAGDLLPGGYEFVWRGDDDHGRQMASGVYIYRLRTGGFVQARRMTLLK